MRNPFKKRPTITGVMLFSADGQPRYGLNSIPKEPELSDIRAATVKEVEAYLKGVMK